MGRVLEYTPVVFVRVANTGLSKKQGASESVEVCHPGHFVWLSQERGCGRRDADRCENKGFVKSCGMITIRARQEGCDKARVRGSANGREDREKDRPRNFI